MSKDRYNNNGEYIGYTDDDGCHYDKAGNYIGYTDDDGYHYDKNGEYAGLTDDDGYHYDKNGEYAGLTDESGDSYNKNGEYSGRTENSSSGGCYLTTACVEYKGLSDDCKELTLLRSFRDTYMKDTMPADIDRYYDIAPGIVDKINRLGDTLKNKHYDYIYNIVIKCCNLIEAKQFDEAYREYKLMVQTLSEI